jgi:hypothetical protein
MFEVSARAAIGDYIGDDEELEGCVLLQFRIIIFPQI